MNTLTLYVVQNKDGKYFRSRGYNGYGDSWVAELDKARVYGKIGPAKSQVTWWGTHHPEFGVPDIIPLIATTGVPINQEERVGKVALKKQIDKLTRQLYRIEERYDKATREYERHKSQYALNELNKVLNEMKSKVQEIEKLKR